MTQPINAMDAFAATEKAEAYGSSQYIEEGKFVFKIRKCILKASSKDGSVFFIAECETVESNADHTPVGSTRSEIINLSRKDVGPSLMKGFALALGPDIQDSDVTRQELAKLVQDDQPAAGIYLNCEAWGATSQKGNPITKKKWSYNVEYNEAAEEVAEA